MSATASRPATSDTPAQRRKSKVRRSLEKSGLRLVAEHGLEKVSVEQILEAAGYSRRTFYGYYANKLELLATALNPVFDEGASYLDVLGKQEPSKLVAGIADCYLELWKNNRDALIAIASFNDPAIAPYIESGHRKFGGALQRVLHKAEDAGELRNDDANCSFKIISRTAVPLLKTYAERANGAELYRDSILALLQKPDTTH